MQRAPGQPPPPPVQAQGRGQLPPPAVSLASIGQPAPIPADEAKRRPGRPPGTSSKHRRGYSLHPPPPCPPPPPPPPVKPLKNDTDKTIRGKGWGTIELQQQAHASQQLIDAWNYCLMYKAGIDEKSGQFHERVFQRFSASCTGECGSTDGVCKRTVKSVGDKIASVRLMYKFIKEFNTHDKIEGSKDLPDWYRLDKKTRKEFCRKFDRQSFDRQIFIQLELLFEGVTNEPGYYPMPHFPPPVGPNKRPRLDHGPPGFNAAAEIKNLTSAVQQQNESLVKMVQEWRESDREERDMLRKAEQEERAKDRESLLDTMKLMLEALKSSSGALART